ncbi:unnamed protein product (macronuclear) [Paramecium tetraurelia]|uniref:Uncharacterized protein n=1 Tax=Paramecium tetraurelia TaxID=5888 RepID=A0C906_PARTE|nr:uncharacterized protein GSPATT00006579001 [Paramecium tetraurelia]CAK67273.1 unnamed protein product [Paramecium tetraurelia]|eukprot:XP_001434670.1 hypothetical protein (macronuclear) [Paramecium tetraurelia strain d4-2]
MGNYCHKEETPQSDLPTLRKSIKGKNVFQILIQTNTQFIEQCQDLYFKQFHKNIVEKDIQTFSKFMNQKMLDSSIKGKYPTEEEKQVISNKISRDIAQKEKHIYNQLIFHYSQFLNELFEMGQNQQSKPISAYKAGDIRINAQLNKNISIKRTLSDNHRFQGKQLPDQNTSQSKNIDQNIIRQFQENKQLATTFLDQLSCFFKLLYLIIEYVYSNYIVSIFGSSIDSFTDRYILISKVYQKNIIKANPFIQKLITAAIQIKYETQQSLIKSEHMSPAILQSKFIPENVDSILSGGELDVELLDSIEQNLKYQQSDQKHQNFHYYQTFSTIDRIVNCKMPWLKFILIGKLDLQIVEIFLQARSQSQIAHFVNLIKPEDSKVEVLLYILQRYMAATKNLNLSQCYYELRWMQEYDNVLHQKVKTITCPYFSRFLSLYEMALKNYQRKQTQLLYN